MLSVATVAIFVFPWVQQAQSMVLVALLGAGIGSLVPDVDAEDAAVFHDDIRGLNGDVGTAVNNMIGPLLPIFGHVTKHLIYRPAVFLFDRVVFDGYSFEDRHRTFSHSFLGVFTMTAITGLYMAPVLMMGDVFAPLFVAVFLLSYMAGAFLHMLEDSCTKTGIAWNSPFSKTKLKGNISTGKDIKKPRYFLYYLGILAAGAFYFGSSTQYSFTSLQVTGIALAVVPLSWLVFMKGVARVKID